MTDTPASPWEDRLRRRFVAARKGQERTQAEVARYMKRSGFAWHQQTVQRFESGERPPRLNESLALARFVEADLNDLIRGDEADYARDLLHLVVKDMAGVVGAYEGVASNAFVGHLRLDEAAEVLGAEHPEVVNLTDLSQRLKEMEGTVEAAVQTLEMMERSALGVIERLKGSDG